MEETKKKGSGTTDLTVGRPLTRILQFALPLVLGTLFQQLYSFVDMALCYILKNIRFFKVFIL